MPEEADSLRYTATIPGLVIRDEEVSGSTAGVTIELDQDELYSQGYTSVVLGADSMEIRLVGKINGESLPTS